MTISATPAGSLNLAILSTAERQIIDQHKEECLERWKQAQAHASQIYLGLKGSKGRVWAENQLKTRPDIESETRRQLNLLLKVKK